MRLTINCISVLYSTPAFFRQVGFFSRKGRHTLKTKNRAVTGIMLSHLMCTAIIVQPLMIPSAVAKGDSAPHPVSEETMGGKSYCVTHVVVKARPEQVWRVLSDYPNAPSVFPQLKNCQVLEDRGTTKIVRHVIEPSGVPGRYKYVLELKETAPHAMEWHRVSGDFKEVDGFWKLEPLEGGRATFVTYSTHVNGGMFIPQTLIKHQCKVDMPAVMTSLKAQAEHASVEIAGRPTSGSNQ